MADTNKVQLLLKRGVRPSLPEQGKFTNGTLYFTTDEGGLYLGLSDGSGVRMQGSVLYFETLETFYNNVQPPYSKDVLYFIEKTVAADGTTQVFNALMRWDGEKWIQINATAEAFQSLSDTVSDLKDNFDALVERVDAAEEDINTLESYVGEPTKDEDGKVTDTETLFEKAYAARVDIDELAALLGVPADGATDASGLFATVAANTAAIAENKELIEGVQEINVAQQEAIDGINTSISGINTSIGEINTTLGAKADQTDLDAVAQRVGTLETGIATKAEQKTVDDINDRLLVVEGYVGDPEDTAEDDTVYGKLADHTAQLSALDGAVATNAQNIENNDERISALEEALGTGGTGTGSLSDRVATLESGLSDANDLITNNANAIAENKAAIEANDGEIADLDSRVDTLEGEMDTAQSDISDLKTKVADNAADIATNAGAIEDLKDQIGAVEDNYATKEELNTAKTELKDQIDDHILAANAMRYKGAVADVSELPDASDASEENGVQIGDTYIASKAFKLADGTQVYAGDLLVAEGTEIETEGDTYGYISADSLTWTVVDTGYIESHENKLEIDETNQSINLMSHLGEALSSISIKSQNDNVSVTYDNSTSSVILDMVWGEF